MDIVFDPPGSGVFSEVYLYEELMEADLHAIVSWDMHDSHELAHIPDPFKSTALGRTLPIIPLSNPLRAKSTLLLRQYLLR
jgi:hypothetical protein